MSLETAKDIIETEVRQARALKEEDGVRFNLFGGEPLLRFDLIKELCQWVWKTIDDVKCEMVITTNGTLLDDDKKQWLAAHKDRIHLIMSVDGKDDVQECNRGCHSSDLPIEFVLKTMPKRFLSMTASRQSLPRFADDLIYFYEQGYRVEGKPAQGIDWQEGDGKIYEVQLARIANYYLEHPEVTPTFLFKDASFIQLLGSEPNEKYAKMCDAGVTFVAYDVDGKRYPCHHFIPNVHGKEDILEDLKNIDFSDTSRFIDDECMKCDILKLCRTCCGRNYNERGDVRFRDRRTCQMVLAESRVISSYQIKKLMRNRDRLTSKELLMLKAAVKCYQLCCDFERKFYARNG
jgi:radical SAM protein with 4Fe4S-binding SPASM domain